MQRTFKISSLFLMLVLMLSSVQYGFAQQKKKPHRSVRDSVRQKILQRDSLIRSFKHTDDASLDDLLGKIEEYSSLYTQTNSDLSKGFDTLDVSQRLPNIERRMNLMKNTLDNSGTSLGYLVTIRNMIDRVIDQTNAWEELLTKYNNQLDSIHTDIVAFKNDTALHTAPEDSSLEEKYVLQVQQLESKWLKLDSSAKKAIIKIGHLQNRVAQLSILMIDLDDKVDLKIQQFAANSLENECGFIWNMHKQTAVADSAYAKTYNLNFKLYKYFFTSKNNYWSHLGSIVLLIGFLGWLFNSKRKISQTKNKEASVIFNQTRYVVKHPYAATVAVFSILAPYLYDHPAQVFVQSMLLIMMASVGLLIKDNWPQPLFKFWIALFVMAVGFSLSNLMIVITHGDRWLLLLLSVFGIYNAIYFLKHLKKSPDDYPPYIRIGVQLFIVINAISVLLNIAGRFSLAKIAGSTAIFGLCLAMGLYVFVQILMESLFLQLEANKKVDDQSIVSFIDFKVLQKKFKNVVVKVAVVLWLIAQAKNMVIDDYLLDQANDFLKHPYKFSSTAFTFGSILIFIIIIWISGLIARVISYFYDFAGQQIKLTPQAKKTRSSILLIRLTVFVIGFFVALTAAGIPMERVTIIIGALGVGIGFGLQNIVNNLVSGIILAFEKPVQVGDIIEVSGKAGTIKEIGIRSSKIDCGDGSELIVPNGDLISQHVVNWTLTNNNRRVELMISVAHGSDISKVEDILKTVINSHDGIMKSPAPTVFLHNFSENSIDFKALFWAEDIGKWVSLKSSVLSDAYTQFAKEGIEIPHGKGDVKVYLPDGTNLPASTQKNEPPTENPPA